MCMSEGKMMSAMEEAQIRFLAIILPGLTLCTHILLALSFVLPGSELNRDWVSFSLCYNVCAGVASILGVVGALKLLPRLVSAYTLTHTVTLSFVNIALVNVLVPFDFQLLNPVIPSWSVDETAICRDIDAGLGWDEEWLAKCSRSFGVVRWCVAFVGLFLMIGQWWALITVRRWGKEMRFQRRTGGDVEKEGILRERDERFVDEKSKI